MGALDPKLKSTLAWLLLAALCGLVGFLIVYHYATVERASEHFAIVVDAGSTQTRSSLYRITVHVPELAEWQERVSEQFAAHPGAELDEAELESSELKFPLSSLVQVRQVSTCDNGGPLAAISGPAEANELIRGCLVKFVNHIKLLDFGGHKEAAAAAAAVATQDVALDADEVNRQLALTSHRVNSVTHFYLGATAGMRALELANATRAREKLHWVEEALSRTNQLIIAAKGGPFVNRGFVGIIEGSDEASLGWVSVNFISDTLYVHPAAPFGSQPPRCNQTGQELDSPAYHLQSEPAATAAAVDFEPGRRYMACQPHSIGTLELGGASAQMAFQVVDNQLGSRQIQNTSMDEQQLELFNARYRMATRSDLCLGMSQAVLRLNYVLLHRLFATQINQTNGQLPPTNKAQNPCLQRGARLNLDGPELAKVWRGACLRANLDNLNPAMRNLDAAFRAAMARQQWIELLGTGQTEQCAELLGDLIEPTKCRRYFELCPAHKIEQPPKDMPFVTISGYNHALNVLGLQQPQTDEPLAKNDQHSQDTEWQKLSQIIDNKLGGSSISHSEFIDKTRQFCSTNANELLQKYPKVKPKFRDIICLQLVYMRKLLTEFYRFEPGTNWSQIKFLIFAPKSVPNQFSALKKTSASAQEVKLDARRDIGWTLGLLLNATSLQLDSSDSNQIYFRHGATVGHIFRATVLLMLACCLIALGLLVVGVVEVRRAQDRADAYIGHLPSTPSSSSYDVSHLGPTQRSSSINGAKSTGPNDVLPT